MPARPSTVLFPEMALTLVRRVTAKLPYNHYLFRTDPKWTKLEVKEYLQKIYNVKVARITTYISPGKVRRAPGKRLLFKLKDYKKVYVRIDDGKTGIDAPAAAAKTVQMA